MVRVSRVRARVRVGLSLGLGLGLGSGPASEVLRRVDMRADGDIIKLMLAAQNNNIICFYIFQWFTREL